MLPHLTDTRQLTRQWMEEDIFPLADSLREERWPEKALQGRALYCLFYEPSFLTRTTFERAMTLLGGYVQFTEDASQFFPVRTVSYVEDTIRFLASLHFDVVVLRSSQSGVLSSAAEANVLPIINGGSDTDHPTQALLDLYTLRQELGEIDGIFLAVVGRVNHRNVNALLMSLTQYRNVRVVVVPFSGTVNHDVLEFCHEGGVKVSVENSISSYTQELDAVYLNGAETAAHAQLLVDRNMVKVRIDEDLLRHLRKDCVILYPTQRMEPWILANADKRWAGYRQAENGLYVRMALLQDMLKGS